VTKYQDLFAAEVAKHVTRAFDVEENVRALIVQPPDFRLGQAAVPCHSFAKKLRKSPVKIAEEIAATPVAPELTTIAKVEAVNGYVNFHCRFEAYGGNLLKEIKTGKAFSTPLLDAEKREKISIEYSQPNTHKALHVGHLRNMVFGDSVCRIMEYAGHDIVRTTYPGDMGAHIAKSLFYIHTQGKKAPETFQADWLGEMYAESDDYVKSVTDPAEQAKNKAQVGEVLKALQEKRGHYYELYLQTREWSLLQMREVYDWLGIHFDVWFYESECDEPSRELVLQKFNEGFFVKSEGAIGLDLSQYNLGFALFLKSDGNGLYLTKDLELIRRKFADPAITRSIVVVDARQKLHFQQLFKTAELMGYPQAAKSVHLSYESVTTPDGKPCSSRNLNGILLDQLREVIEQKIITDYLNQYRGQWTDEEIHKTAEMVALGALKYGFLHVDGGNIIKFQLEEWLKLDGDTGPYLQYVHARCSSILEKVGQPEATYNVVLETDFERELLFMLGRFNNAALLSAESYRPSVVTAYLYDLCKVYNRFYKECPIKTTEGDQKNTRLALVEATAATLRKGLDLLGIPAPKRM
jgi:arginyl-tRNA synthetase